MQKGNIIKERHQTVTVIRLLALDLANPNYNTLVFSFFVSLSSEHPIQLVHSNPRGVDKFEFAVIFS